MQNATQGKDLLLRNRGMAQEQSQFNTKLEALLSEAEKERTLRELLSGNELQARVAEGRANREWQEEMNKPGVWDIFKDIATMVPGVGNFAVNADKQWG